MIVVLKIQTNTKQNQQVVILEAVLIPEAEVARKVVLEEDRKVVLEVDQVILVQEVIPDQGTPDHVVIKKEDAKIEMNIVNMTMMIMIWKVDVQEAPETPETDDLVKMIVDVKTMAKVEY